MGWCILGTLLRWATAPLLWRTIICRVLPKGGWGAGRWAFHGMAICAHVWKRERDWWQSTPGKEHTDD